MNIQLDHSESYQWIGSFWFPRSDGTRGKEFAGEVTYQPGKGVRLRWSSEGAFFHDGDREEARKVAHGIVRHHNTVFRVTLYNVWGIFGAHMGQSTRVKTMNGQADMIVFDDHLPDDQTFGLQVQYDEAFEAMLITRKNGPAAENERLRLSKADPIKLLGDCSLAYRLTTTVSNVHSLDDLAGIFWSNKDLDLSLLKAAVAPLFETGEYGLRNSALTMPTINLETPNTKIVDALATEKTFRQFWSLLGDQPVFVKKLWLRTRLGRTATGQVLWGHHPALLTQFGNLALTNGLGRRMRDMKLHLYTFNSKEHSIANAQDSLEAWFEMNGDARFGPVIDGIMRLVTESDKLADRTRYATLCSEVETFLDLINMKNANIDTLIELYASDAWRASFDTVRQPILRDETSGKFAHEIRNVIAHPKSAAKKAGGRYAAVVADRAKLQDVYAHVGGLLVKAVLTKVGGIEPVSLEQFTMQFIESRASYEMIDYK